ncbi:Acyltransferase family protein associated with ethylmalonyl-CoA pathway [Rubellimicrobium mesophilum DSM 19309]|uniref:Glycerol-3-phosphate acyltransferase n=1 Tax=Rubellimicrobium mesophilum DSM 19309 TaxID=442562 RepID=A0A017HVA3_9RHOB|nr:1-acyl-sn-glycerol-3-phosphate acyltransferase [Rubellimicrobium mesophilum]EYD78048.1 Acyltransferase family protein associated with ethylmalonyl-CoA pathway [Rubellimicrobium mesophilum DSM 19309]
MTRTIAIPLWLLILILLFAGVTFASHFLFPSVRWFFRRRMERAVARLNTRLARPIEPFKLARRYDMIQRLIYDPAVTRAVAEEARAEGIPENVAFERARDYAREIVPAFSATLYFGWGARLARWLSRSLYRIRLPQIDMAELDRLPPDAAVVFVMNHRSNMDYVLVTWLVSASAALSYAVGEWARVWPLSGVIRMMGAFFIRRRNHSALYRRVLQRYVQMATAAGVTQAIFPEGRLSLDGRLGAPRLGLLSYIVEGAPEWTRDVVFVPVALNYDRVLEDRFLIRARVTGERRFRPPLGEVLGGLGRHLAERVTMRFRGLGTAKVVLGPPLSLREFLAGAPDQPTEALGRELMDRIARAMPALPVPLVARHLLDGRAWAPPALEDAIRADLDVLEARGADMPGRGPIKIVEDALGLLLERGAIVAEGGRLRRAEGAEDLLAYYAGSIAHLFATGS